MSGNTAYADKAVQIMNAYAGWAAADFQRFQTMMLTVFYPMNSGMLTTPSSLLVYSNWDLCALASILAIAGLGDDREKFNSAAITSRPAWAMAGSVGTLYVNGVAVGTNSAMTTVPFRLGSTDQNCLGRSQYPADPYFNGLIDDFRIYRGGADRGPDRSLVSPTCWRAGPHGSK